MKNNNEFEYICNEDIVSIEVNLVTEEGIKKFSLSKALDFAERENLDLVQITNDKVPICKIMNFKKFIYEQKQKQKQQAKKNRENVVILKEIKIRLNIDPHDRDIKIKKIREFIEDNNRVKIEILLRGREILNKKQARESLTAIVNNLEKIKKETDIQESNKSLWIIVSPIKEK